jgi:solute carrier family 25 phosphate transporter 3
MALTTGLGATATGYFVQGWFKFGGVEYFKIQGVQYLGEEAAWEKKTQIYLASAACAEFIADIFLCPLEAVRIRSVSDPEFCDGLADGFSKMAKSEGIGGFYAGFFPILAKQIPYTCAKFVVQGSAADKIYASMGTNPDDCTGGTNLGISLLSGVVAGVAAAIISHPADTLLSKVNKAGAGGTGSMISRLTNIASEIGFYNLCTVGLVPRCVMIGTLTAGQCKWLNCFCSFSCRSISLKLTFFSFSIFSRYFRHCHGCPWCYQVPLPQPQHRVIHSSNVVIFSDSIHSPHLNHLRSLVLSLSVKDAAAFVAKFDFLSACKLPQRTL